MFLEYNSSGHEKEEKQHGWRGNVLQLPTFDGSIFACGFSHDSGMLSLRISAEQRSPLFRWQSVNYILTAVRTPRILWVVLTSKSFIYNLILILSNFTNTTIINSDSFYSIQKLFLLRVYAWRQTLCKQSSGSRYPPGFWTVSEVCHGICTFACST